MTKGELMKIANEQIDYMLKHNGEQSEEISKKASTKSIAAMKKAHEAWYMALAERSKNKKVEKELKRMCAWECHI